MRIDEPIRPLSDLDFKARMTNAQFRAVAMLLNRSRLGCATHGIMERPPFCRATGYHRQTVARWFANAWNTERVLKVQATLDEESKRFALHWTFPQAYYACFCQLMAFFNVVGCTETSHNAVLRRFGEHMRTGKYPVEMTWYADGGQDHITTINVAKHSMPCSYYLDESNPLSISNQVAQLLHSTRMHQLLLKRIDLRKNFRTKTGKVKERLTHADWEAVSQRLGPTTILDFLYRKRIKANYREIDTFLQSEIDGAGIIDGLLAIVDGFAFIHEAFVVKILGTQEFDSIANSYAAICPELEARKQQICGLH